jgi:hypothetical protein
LGVSGGVSVGFMSLSRRLPTNAFSLLLKQLSNGTQRFVDLFSGSKLPRDVWLKNNDVRAFGVPCCMLPSHTFAEVLFWTHCVPFVGPLPSSLFLHNFSVQPASPVVRFGASFMAAQEWPPKT